MNNDDFFNTNGRGLNPEWEARVVAWVLGEASPFEAAELERLCTEHPELAVFKYRIEAVHGLTGEAVKQPTETLRLSPERRAKLLAVIGGKATTAEPTSTVSTKTPKQSPWWREWALPMAACLALMLSLAAVMAPKFGNEHGKQVVFEAAPESPDSPGTPPSLGGVPLLGRAFTDTAVAMEAPAPAPVATPALQAAQNNRSQLGTGTGYATSAAGVRGRQTTAQVSVDPFAAPAKDKRAVGAKPSRAGVDQWVSEGRSQYLAGDMEAAQESFRAVEAQSPNDPQAKAFLYRIAMEKAAVAGLKRVKQRSEMIEEVTHSWQRPAMYADVSATGESTESIETRLDRIIIPSISFTNTPIAEVIPALMSASIENDNSQNSGGGTNIVYVPADGGNPPRVSLTLRNLSVRRILDILTEATGTQYEVRDDTVVVFAPEPLPQVIVQRSETGTADEPVSTFSLHVGDASFRVAKAALERGEEPDPATIRPEEFYNAFDYGDPAPVAGEAVACRIEQAAHPFLQQRNVVRIAMRVPAVGRGASQPLRLTVLLDTSGSMEREDRAASVRAALVSLAALLGPDDRVSLVGFARTPRLLAEAVPGDQAIRVVDIAAKTPAEGGTNVEEALQLAGEIAARQWLAGAQNRIVLLTDGAANLGNADPRALMRQVEALRQRGIAFDACGVVADGLDDTVLEALTRKGDGRYTIIGSPEEADARFARQLAGAFRPAAKDVKVQVVFNPARVARYRLIGFEQHRLRTEDFRDDTVDAAELASEEAAVAVYQVEALPEGEGELGEVFVRFLDTGSGQRVERSWTLPYVAQPAAFDRASPSMQLAASAAFLAEELRGGDLAGQIRLDEFAPVVEGLAGAYPRSVRVREFIEMFRQTRRLVGE